VQDCPEPYPELQEFRTNHEPYMVHGMVQGTPSPVDGEGALLDMFWIQIENEIKR
jgi:hypothetical protein